MKNSKKINYLNIKILLLVFIFMIVSLIISTNVLAVYIPLKGNPNDYDDISNHWANSSINYVIENGYFKGMTSNKFEPETNMSRAMIVTVLWRLTGDDLTYTKTVDGVTRKIPKYVNMFWDMKDDDWYTNYISWANKNNIIDGYSKREFRPNEAVSREQLAVILYNYLKNYKLIRSLDVYKVNEAVAFTDEALISDWAKDKVTIIQQIGLMEGRTEGNFAPKETVTRAEVAVVIERLVKML